MLNDKEEFERFYEQVSILFESSLILLSGQLDTKLYFYSGGKKN